MIYQLTDEQRNRIREIANEYFVSVLNSDGRNCLNAIEQALTELAPAIREEGRQAGLEKEGS